MFFFFLPLTRKKLCSSHFQPRCLGICLHGQVRVRCLTAMEIQIGSPTSRRALDMCYTLSWVWLSIGHSWAGPEEGDLSGEIKCFSHLWLCLTLGLWLRFHLAENNLIYFRCSYRFQVVQLSSCHKPLHRFSWFTRVPTDPGTDLWMTVNSASG